MTRHQLAHKFFPGLGAALLLAGGLALLDGPAVDARGLGVPQAQPPAQAQRSRLSRRLRRQRHLRACHTARATRSRGRRTGRRRTRARRRRRTAAKAATGPARRTSTTRRRDTSGSSRQMKPAEISETCLTCHNRGNHAGWDGSAHERAQPVVHDLPQRAQPEVARNGSWSSRPKPQLCATCHRLQVTKTERAVAHMPVREGKMACSSCHNPHGSISNVKALQGRQLGRRAVHELPRRDARADAVGARARARELRDLSRSARLVERSHAGRPHADALSALPRRDASIRRRSTTTTRSP